MAFKIGDKIDSIYGTGEVIDDDFDENYPMQVKFDNTRYVRTFKKDGRESGNHQFPSIWHLETGTPPCVGEEPKRKPWIPDGLTPCWVWNDDKEDRKKALVYSYYPPMYEVIIQYRIYGQRGLYAHAEPLPKDEIPEWMKF